MSEYQACRNYQDIVEKVRWREDFFSQFNGGGWPGHYGKALSRYPNLAAELNAREWEISNAVKAANVSREVMAGVIEDGDFMDDFESLRIAQRLDVHCRYLRSPVLSMVDPNTNKGRLRIARLKFLLYKMDVYGLRGGQPEINARGVLADMEHGKLVTYAAYSWAVHKMERDTCEHEAKELCRQSCRTVRQRAKA